MTSADRQRRISGAIPLLITLAVGVVWFLVALGFPEPREPSDPGARALPGAAALVTIILSAILLVRRPEGTPLPSGVPALRIVLMVLALGAYAFAFDQLGFILATVAFLTIGLRVGGVISPWQLIALPIVGSVLLYYVFDSALQVALPAGPLGEVLPL